MKLTAIFASAVMCLVFAVATAQAKAISLPAQCLKASKIICVSKTDRKVRLVVNGKVVLSMDARFGDARPQLKYHTHEGMLKVLYREPRSWSKEFKVAMPYSLYFWGHDQAIHYSFSFASDGYGAPSYASHGCVNIRDKTKLKALFDRVQVGTPVFIYH